LLQDTPKLTSELEQASSGKIGFVTVNKNGILKRVYCLPGAFTAVGSYGQNYFEHILLKYMAT